MNTEVSKYQKAKKRVGEIRGFYTHLGVYVLINAMLLLINITTSPDVLWFYWPLMGWGIGVALHALRVFGASRWFGAGWEERKIEELMEQGGNQ
jgi:hypothetical protein